MNEEKNLTITELEIALVPMFEKLIKETKILQAVSVGKIANTEHALVRCASGLCLLPVKGDENLFDACKSLFIYGENSQELFFWIDNNIKADIKKEELLKIIYREIIKIYS